MSGTLYVVATPIGNLEDITLRALRILRDVGLIAAEDTRRTARLLAHHGIASRTISFHEHNARARVPQMIARLQAGDNVALVSDAGTPIISDPGFELVRACLAADIPVDPVPGASAPLAALVVSGFPTDKVVLMGFPPARGNNRNRWISDVATRPETVIFFESPHRIQELLTKLASLSGDRPILVARELTKLHQQLIRGTVREVLASLQEFRGEITLVLSAWSIDRNVLGSAASSQDLWLEFCRLTENRALDRRQAIGELSRRYGYKPKAVYAMLEEAKVSGK